MDLDFIPLEGAYRLSMHLTVQSPICISLPAHRTPGNLFNFLVGAQAFSQRGTFGPGRDVAPGKETLRPRGQGCKGLALAAIISGTFPSTVSI